MDIRILIICLLLIFACISIGAFFGVCWVPTRKKDYKRIVKLAGLKPNMIFCDLGSGTGGLLFYVSKKYNISCIGIEISPILYLYSKIRSLFYKKVDIKFGNLFKYNLSKVDVVYAFLHPKLYNRLKKKLNAEMQNKAKVILAAWPFKGLQPIQIDKKRGKVSYYLYKKPFRPKKTKRLL